MGVGVLWPGIFFSGISVKRSRDHGDTTSGCKGDPTWRYNPQMGSSGGLGRGEGYGCGQGPKGNPLYGVAGSTKGDTTRRSTKGIHQGDPPRGIQHGEGRKTMALTLLFYKQ
jgi:hypothetical protein